MKRLMVFGFILVGLLIVLFGPNASAHVLITDTSGTKGAILHIIPDDDPIAGQEATLFFDTQGGVLNNESVVELTIADEPGQVSNIETSVEGSLVTAKYVFPSQGVYVITYEVQTNGSTYIFEQTTRIARGVMVGNTQKMTYVWAEVVLYLCGALGVMLVIIAWNHRREIIRHSTL